MEGMIDREALERYVDRVLELHELRRELNGDIAEVYAEAKSASFVTTIIRQVVREKQMDSRGAEAHYSLLDTTGRPRHARRTPLGEAAPRAATEAHRGHPPPRQRRAAPAPLPARRAAPACLPHAWRKASDEDARALARGRANGCRVSPPSLKLRSAGATDEALFALLAEDGEGRASRRDRPTPRSPATTYRDGQCRIGISGR